MGDPMVQHYLLYGSDRRRRLGLLFGPPHPHTAARAIIWEPQRRPAVKERSENSATGLRAMAKTRRPLFARHQFRESAILSAFLALAFVAVQLEPAAGEERAVPSYRAEASRSGHFIVPGLTWERARTLHRDQDFEAHFPGHVHAQPLYWRPPREEHGVLVVATEENSVHALDSKSGQEV